MVINRLTRDLAVVDCTLEKCHGILTHIQLPRSCRCRHFYTAYQYNYRSCVHNWSLCNLLGM